MCRDTKCTVSTVSLENIMKRKQELKKGTGDRYFPRPWRGNHELAFSFSERHLVISIKRGNKIPVLWSINSILLWGNCCCSVIQSCLTLCNTIDCSVPGFPVLHYLLGFVQTQVHWGGDASNHLILSLPFSSCLHSFPVSRSFPVSQLFARGGQNIGASASATVLWRNNSWCTEELMYSLSSDGSDNKESASSVGDPGSIAGLRRSPGEENGYPLQYSCLENPMDWGAWQATVHEVAKNQTRLNH